MDQQELIRVIGQMEVEKRRLLNQLSGLSGLLQKIARGDVAPDQLEIDQQGGITVRAEKPHKKEDKAK